MADVKGFDIQIGLDTSEVNSKLKSFQSDLKSTQKQLKNVAADLKLDPKNIDALTKKSKLLKDAIKNVSSQLKIQSEKLKEAGKLLSSGQLEGGQAAFDALQKKVNATKGQLGSLNSELERTNERIGNLKQQKWQSIGDMGNAFSVLSKSIAAAAAALTAFVGAGVASLTSLSDAAATANMTAEEYQRLAYAANVLGVKTEDASKGVQKVSEVFGQLAAGTGKRYEQLLNKIGLSYSQLNGLSTEDQFKAIADAIANCGDSTTALYVAQQLFGAELANKLLPLLNAGAESINELEDSAVVASEESVDAAKKISTAVARIKSAFVTLAGSIASYVEPVVEKLTAWIETNVVPTLQKVVDAFFSLDESTQKMIAGIVAAVAAAGPLLVSITKIHSGVSALFKTLKGGKIALIIAAIAAVAAIMVKLYNENDKFREQMNAIGSQLKEVIGVLIDELKPVFDELMEIIIDKILPVVVEIVKNVLPILVPILKIAASVIKVIASVLGAVWDILKPVFDLLGKLFGKLDEWVSSDGFVNWLKSVVKWFENLSDGIGNAIDSVKEFFGNIGNNIANGWDGFTDWLSSWTGNWKKGATGGVVTSATPMIVGEAGAEAIMPLENNTGWMTKMAAMIARAMPSYMPQPAYAGADNSSTNNTYNVTINTSASSMSIREIDEALGGAYK